MHYTNSPVHYTGGGGGGVAPGIFCTRKFCAGFISHSGLKLEREISHASRESPPPPPGGSCMTRISIPGPKHTFVLVAVQPVCPNFGGKKVRPLVCKRSFSWHMTGTGITLAVVQPSINNQCDDPPASWRNAHRSPIKNRRGWGASKTANEEDRTIGCLFITSATGRRARTKPRRGGDAPRRLNFNASLVRTGLRIEREISHTFEIRSFAQRNIPVENPPPPV